jgi:hypothetical protein
MSLIQKVIIWCISFPISLFVISVLSALEYISLVFSMPLDIWNIISGEVDEKEDS